MERYVCIHGHFYQPPRENPWLESIEIQDSAYPYHDWNEKITAECYAPNAVSRILDGKNRITQIVNNYSKISFNFGPTLLSWLQIHSPSVYDAIQEADQESQQHFSGHGSALAQPYNHMVMPLANLRDKHTQVIWGIRDFQYRFKRDPEGMWLPETAVDIETLEVLAEHNIRFTLLAPSQAKQIRPIGSKDWHNIEGEKIDPTMAYLCRLPSSRTIVIFFYDGPIAKAVAFEGLLSSGENFAQRLNNAFSDSRPWPQLVHIATDGETYGHHHKYGDMALAYAINYIETRKIAKITNYAQYLEMHPPAYEVIIAENTSWSCGHGIERWRNNCGCNVGSNPRWNQNWRTPLRNAFDWLRNTLEPKYEKRGQQLLKNPWTARDDYIDVILNRSTDNSEKFLKDHAINELNIAQKTELLKLFEMQRNLMLMYTSCGWFFDDLSGIETVQVIQYAGRAVQLAQEIFSNEIEKQFLEILSRAKSNVSFEGNGRNIYEKHAKPSMVHLRWVAAHYAISSLFEDYNDNPKIYCYKVDVKDYKKLEAGRATLAIGRVNISSEITLESARLTFGVLHLGDHNINAGVRIYEGKNAYQTALFEMKKVFSTGEFPEVVRVMDKHFGHFTYTIRYLFRNEQRKVLNRILGSTLSDLESAYRQVYDSHYPLMLFLADIGHPLPEGLHGVAEFIINTDMHRALTADIIDIDRVKKLLDEAHGWDIKLQNEELSYIYQNTLVTIMENLISNVDDLKLLDNLCNAVELTRFLPFEVNLWKVQNIYWMMLQYTLHEYKRLADMGDETAEKWIDRFKSLGECLHVSAL